jgi:tetratricopeptide (TPR) repeat protein
MNRYHRLPSFLVLLIVVGAGSLYMHRYGRANGNGGRGLEALEKIIQKGKADKETWFSYAEALSDAGKYDRAAQAFKKVLELEPSHRQAKVGCALSLAQATKTDELYSYVKDLVFSEPKLAMDLLERPELSTYMSDARFAALQKEAKAQAMD